MMDLESLKKDIVFIINGNGCRSGPYKTSITNDGDANISDEMLDAVEGYKLVRQLPNGKEDVFTILEANYNSGLGPIPAYYSLKLKKDSSLLGNKMEQNSTTVNINNSQGIQVGDNNIQNITNSLGELIQQIDNANTSPKQKEAAKGKIKELISNPTVASILGGATAGLLALL